LIFWLIDIIFTEKIFSLLSGLSSIHLLPVTLMQHRDQESGTDGLQPVCCAPCEEDQEQVVVFELIVPRAAKIALPRQQPEIGPLILQENSVTTTVPARLCVQRQASNTATRVGWCMTATLAAASPTSLRANRR
jgi:hypothetical protein